MTNGYLFVISQRMATLPRHCPPAFKLGILAISTRNDHSANRRSGLRAIRESFTPDQCVNYFAAAGCNPSNRIPVYGSTETHTHEEASAGIVDAIVFTANGAPQVVIDWRSDLDPSPETLEHYRAQVRNYLDIKGAERGLVVCVTPGTAILVTQAAHGLG